MSTYRKAQNLYKLVDINKRKTCWKQTTVSNLFSDRNPSRGMRSLLRSMQVHVVSKTLYTKTLSIEFHLITGIVCVVNSANKLMKGHTTYFKPLRGSALLCYFSTSEYITMSRSWSHICCWNSTERLTPCLLKLPINCIET